MECRSTCAVVQTANEVAAIFAALIPLLFLIHRLVLGRHVCAKQKNRAPNHSGGAAAEASISVAAAEYDFATLMERFRESDPDRLGLDVDSLEYVVGGAGAVRLRQQLVQAGKAGGGARLSVSEFVPIACALAASPSKPGLPAPPPPEGYDGDVTPAGGSSREPSLRPREADTAGAAVGPTPPLFDVHAFAQWLAAEHRRVLNVLLLSNAGEAPRSTIAAAAQAYVAAEATEAALDTEIAGAAARTPAKSVTIAHAPSSVGPVSADGLQLCLQLLRTLAELARSGDLLSKPSGGGDGGGGGGADLARQPSRASLSAADGFGAAGGGALLMQHLAASDAACALIKDALVGGELPNRTAQMFRAPLAGSARLRKLQLEVRAAAAACLRAVLEGPPPPVRRVVRLCRAVRPSAVRRALTAHLESEAHAPMGREGAIYSEQLALLLAATLTVLADARQLASSHGAYTAAQRAYAPAPAEAELAMEISAEMAAEMAPADGARGYGTAGYGAAEYGGAHGDGAHGDGAYGDGAYGDGARGDGAYGAREPHPLVEGWLRRVLCVPLPLPAAAVAHVARPKRAGEGAAEPAAGPSSTLARQATPSPPSAAPDGAQRVWFLLPRVGEWLLASPAGAHALLALLVGGESLGHHGRAPSPAAVQAALAKLDTLARLLQAASTRPAARALLPVLLGACCWLLALPSMLCGACHPAGIAAGLSNGVGDGVRGTTPGGAFRSAPRSRSGSAMSTTAVLLRATAVRAWLPDGEALGAVAVVFAGCVGGMLAFGQLVQHLAGMRLAVSALHALSVPLAIALPPLLLQVWWHSPEAQLAANGRHRGGDLSDLGRPTSGPLSLVHVGFLLRVHRAAAAAAAAHASASGRVRATATNAVLAMHPAEHALAMALGLIGSGGTRGGGGPADYAIVHACLVPKRAIREGGHAALTPVGVYPTLNDLPRSSAAARATALPAAPAAPAQARLHMSTSTLASECNAARAALDASVAAAEMASAGCEALVPALSVLREIGRPPFVALEALRQLVPELKRAAAAQQAHVTRLGEQVAALRTERRGAEVAGDAGERRRRPRRRVPHAEGTLVTPLPSTLPQTAAAPSSSALQQACATRLNLSSRAPGSDAIKLVSTPRRALDRPADGSRSHRGEWPRDTPAKDGPGRSSLLASRSRSGLPMAAAPSAVGSAVGTTHTVSSTAPTAADGAPYGALAPAPDALAPVATPKRLLPAPTTLTPGAPAAAPPSVAAASANPSALPRVSASSSALMHGLPSVGAPTAAPAPAPTSNLVAPGGSITEATREHSVAAEDDAEVVDNEADDQAGAMDDEEDEDEDEDEEDDDEEEAHGEGEADDSDSGEDSGGWYYFNGQERATAPCTVAELSALKVSGRLPDTSLFWREGLDNWAVLADLPQLEESLMEAEMAALDAEAAALPR